MLFYITVYVVDATHGGEKPKEGQRFFNADSIGYITVNNVAIVI